jgi:diguanylate cyclase (GGDEF)-like protein
MSALAALDPATLLLSVAVLSGVLAALSFALAREVPDHRSALRHWAAAMLCSGTAFALFFLRGHAPAWLTLLASNLAALGLPAFALLAHARLAGRDPQPRTIAALTLAGWAGPLATHLLGAPMWLAVASMSLAAAALSIGAAVLIASSKRDACSAGMLLSMAIFLMLGVVLAARFLVVVFGPEVMAMNSNAPMQIAALFVGTLSVACGTLGMFLLVAERQHRQALESARRDGLTGLLTRAAFSQAARAVLQRGRPVTLLMIDLDFFKRVNDEHGHAGGDIVLVDAARMLASRCRATDLVGRYGGEEFCILLVDCSGQAANDFAQRLVHDARQSSVRIADKRVGYTLSVGHASLDRGAEGPARSGSSLETLFERADRALYAAKHAGRDRSLAASGSDLEGHAAAASASPTTHLTGLRAPPAYGGAD